MSATATRVSMPSALRYARRRVPRRVPCSVRDAELDTLVAFAPSAAPRIVGNGETVITTLRGRAVGLGSVTVQLKPVQIGDEPHAIAKLFDVEAQITITDRRCVVVGGFGWCTAGVVDMTASTFLLATCAHAAVSSVEARRTHIAPRVVIDVVALEPAGALRLTIGGAKARPLLERVASPMLDDRLAASPSPAERARLESLRAGDFDDDGSSLRAWLIPPSTNGWPQTEPPAPAAGAHSEAPQAVETSAWWKPASVAPDPKVVCPGCGERLAPAAHFCRYCGCELA
jgi:hypothetical protein